VGIEVRVTCRGLWQLLAVGGPLNRYLVDSLVIDDVKKVGSSRGHRPRMHDNYLVHDYHDDDDDVDGTHIIT
jgi:hypothetical protein